MPMEIPDETVIVADNDSMMRGLLRTTLERRRRILRLCADGAEAVELAAETVATLVLLDPGSRFWATRAIANAWVDPSPAVGQR